MTKRLIWLAALTVGLTVPTHAQKSHGSAGGIASPSASGSGGGGGSGGGSAASDLSASQFANFSVVDASGSQADYIPSKFVPYDQAVAEGRAVIVVTLPKSLGEVVHEANAAPREKAKFALVQDGLGRAIIVAR